jgi:hypothetical protein
MLRRTPTLALLAAALVSLTSGPAVAAPTSIGYPDAPASVDLVAYWAPGTVNVFERRWNTRAA